MATDHCPQCHRQVGHKMDCTYRHLPPAQQRAADVLAHTNSAECRIYAHAWKPVDVTTDGRWLVQHMECRECGTGKRQRINRHTGLLGPSAYVYPPQYRIPGGGGLDRDQRGALRLALVTAWLTD